MTGSSTDDGAATAAPTTAAAPAASATPDSSAAPEHLSPVADDASQPSSNSPSSRPLTPAFAVQTASASASEHADEPERGQEKPAPTAAAEEMLALLSNKKRALLSEIGALLTLRDRLQSEMRSDHEKGVPFDYAARFAHSPTTLAALEAAADAFRDEMRLEGIHIGKTQRAPRTGRASASVSSQSALAPQPESEPVHPAYSGALFDSSPLATPVQTPSKAHPKKTSASTAQLAARPQSAPAIRAPSFTSPSVQAYPPIHEASEEDEPEDATSELYNGIHAEESVYFDAFDGDESELQQPLAQAPSPAPRSFLQSPLPNRTYERRPATAAASYTPTTRQQPQPQYAHTHRDLPRSSTKYSASSSSSSTPPHALYDSRPSTSSASRPSSRAPTVSSDSPLGWLAQKALLKQQAEQECLAAFENRTLGGVAQEGLTRENKHRVDKPHYQNFNPHAGTHTHEAHSRHASPAQRHAHASPARAKPLQNITNSSTQRHSATKQTHSTPHKESRSQQQTPTFVRW